MAKVLDAYRAKRDFTKTAEPPPEQGPAGGHQFVIQKHDATRLHYDLRLEVDGVMKSWAVAKGPSLVPGEKRLAVEVEDHPIAYNSFEGIIPKGQYGGGTVMIWDRGTWAPEGDVRKGLAKGHLDFTLDGEKLHGRWHLVRMQRRPREKRDNWLLIKAGDEDAREEGDPDILEDDRSVATGRSLDEIADAGDRVWNSNRSDTSKGGEADAAASPKRAAQAAAAAPKETGKTAKKAVPKEAAAKRKRGAALPDFVPPQLATLVAQTRTGPNWLHEIKFDGYRLQARLEDGEVRLLTRGGQDWTARFPDIAEGVAEIRADSALIDGEAVVEDENGVSSFSALQQDLGGRGGKRVSRNAVFYAFDLLFLDGEDLRKKPLLERKDLLAPLVGEADAPRLRYSDHMRGDGGAMMRHACRLGLEGLVSKRSDAPYSSGRTDSWLKVKCSERAEFVIVGYVPSTVAHRGIGSLVLAYYDKGKLAYAGRVGTGFTEKITRDLAERLDALKGPEPTFTRKLETSERRGVRWAKPELVGEIEYRGWTHDSVLRHASYKGLREDKPASEVVREVPKPVGGEPVPTSPKPARAAKKAEKPGSVAGITLTHPDRAFWPGEGITKQGLAEFYADIADWILPHVVDRPLSLLRCPGGMGPSCFFQKHAWNGLHRSIRQVEVPGDDEPQLAIDDLTGLIALVQSGVLEVHVWGSHTAKPDYADRLVFDLDPGEGVAWSAVCDAAREVRDRLREIGLESFLKTSGGKGLHVCVPIEPDVQWDPVKAFTRELVEQMAADSPDRYVATMSKAKRKGRIYLDYLRNGRGATAICAYSTRARAGAAVSTPLEWDELGPSIKADHFRVDNLRARLDALKRDPWEGIGDVRQSLRGLIEATGKKSRKRRAG